MSNTPNLEALLRAFGLKTPRERVLALLVLFAYSLMPFVNLWVDLRAEKAAAKPIEQVQRPSLQQVRPEELEAPQEQLHPNKGRCEKPGSGRLREAPGGSRG